MTFTTDAKGVYPIAPTPFLDDGAIDYASLEVETRWSSLKSQRVLIGREHPQKLPENYWEALNAS